MDKLIDSYNIELTEPACHVGVLQYGALVTLPNDISAIFPYINALEVKAVYDHDNRILIWKEAGQKYAFRPCDIGIAGVGNLEDARKIASEMVDRLNRIWQKRDTITPDFTERRPPPVLGIFKLLPGTNCRQCGYSTCMAFAAALSRGAARLEDCPPLSQAESVENRDKLQGIICQSGRQ